MVQADAERLLRAFDGVVANCRAGRWVRSLDDDAQVTGTEVPLVNHGPPWDRADDDDLNSRWARTLNNRWYDRRHAQEVDKEWHGFRTLLENDDVLGKLQEASLLMVPELLGRFYASRPDDMVPPRYYWTFVTGPHDSAVTAQSIFFQYLRPRQTSLLLRRAFRSGRVELLCERVEEIPEAAPHVLNLFLLDDEVVLRRLLSGLLGTAFIRFGPSHDLLASLIETAERLFVKLGRSPFGPDDNRLHLEALNAVAESTFSVADNLKSSLAGGSHIPRLRGLEAQLELQWPRVTLAGGPNLVTPVIRYQSVGSGKSGAHPADWIRSAARELGDRDAESPAMPPREAMRRVEQASKSRSDWIVVAHYQREFWRIPDASIICVACRGNGRVPCEKCCGQRFLAPDGGIGLTPSKREANPGTRPCFYCAATGDLLCWACQGTGNPPVTL